jgi:hypothetical protein
MFNFVRQLLIIASIVFNISQGLFVSRHNYNQIAKILGRIKSRKFTSVTGMSNSPIVNEHLLKQVNAWCGIHGLMYTDGHITWTPAPISLSPAAYPKEQFTFLKDIQTIWNVLTDRISRDREFLVAELKSIITADEFTKRTMDLYLTIPEEIIRTQHQFGIFRSDYMLNDNEDGLFPLQVEINTISSSFGSLSHKVQKFQSHFLRKNIAHPQIQSLLQTTSLVNHLHLSPIEVLDHMEENGSLQNIAAGIAAAHQAYVTTQQPQASNSSGGGSDTAPRVLFIVQPNERNVSHIEFLLLFIVIRSLCL